MVTQNDKVCISNLNTNEAWIPFIAQWHHQEWLRNHNGLSDCGRSDTDIEKKLKERQETLRGHLCKELMPTTFVSHIDAEPTGTVSLVYYTFSKEQQATEWVTNLYVVPEYRRQGIASTLLQTAVDYACSLNFPRLLLYTSNQVDFYRKRNWRSINKGLVQGQKVEIMDYVFPLT